MRLRTPELLRDRHIRQTGYHLSQATAGALNQTTAQRLIDQPKRVDLETLSTFCRALNIKPSELLTEEPIPPALAKPPRKPAVPKRKPAAKKRPAR